MTDDTNKNLSGKSVLVDMKIVDLRITSGADRLWVGAFTENSFMDVILELRDADTEEIVHQNVLSTFNNAFGEAWSSGTSDRSLPSDFGTLIGEYIFRIVPSTE